MPKEKNKPDYNLVIDQLTANTKELLSEYYARANALCDDNDVTKITIVHRVSTNEFGELIAESQIGFGKRVTDKVEHTVDMTAQFDFGPTTKPAPSPNEAA